MQCRIISIGDELLIGDTVNTNASWLGQVLTESGVDVTHIITLKDDLETIKRELSAALASADLVITTGGLGPTHDDITKQAVAEVFDSQLILHEPTLEFIRKVFKKRNIPFSRSNYHQAEIPDCSEALFNSKGTAPGMWIDKKGALLAVLPGVPHEMKHLMQKKVLPKIREHLNQREIRKSCYLLTAGIGESTLSDEVVGDLSSYLSDELSVAYLPSPWGTRIRISARAPSDEEWERKVRPVVKHIKNRAGALIAGEGKELKLTRVVGQLLADRGLTISAAESCTGGAVANAVTDIPGSSRYFKGGMVTYANEAKIRQLGVDEEDLKKSGAVSKTVALQMAKGIARELNTGIGISTTGVAGPGGGTEEKPVGTVWIGCWTGEQHFALRAQLTKDRLINKERSTAIALEVVRRTLLGMPEMPYGFKKQLP